jgi:predicted transcriptional regulator
MKISNRTRNEIIGSILESANGSSVTMTEILYKTYLSHSLLKKYLSFLLERGLVEYETGRRTFKTTAKGIQFIFAHEQMQKFIVLKTTIPRQGQLK